MKATAYILTCLMTVFFLCMTLHSACQEGAEVIDRYYHNKKYFLQKEHQRINDLLTSFEKIQEKEKSYIEKLHLKNDSLLKSGNIYDSISTDYRSELNLFQSRADSVTTVINIWKQKINPFPTFRQNYNKIYPAVSNLNSTIRIISFNNDRRLFKINQLLDSFDLSGEKARLKEILNKASVQQVKESAKISQVGNKRDSIFFAGNIDNTINEKIDQRLQIYQRRNDSISTAIKDLEQKLNAQKINPQEFRVVKAKVILIDSIVNKNASIREFVFKMIDDGLSNSKRNLFELAAFFGPGGFVIPKSKFEVANKYFSPIIDSLIIFANKYESVLRTATIQVNGYADASQIAKGSKLYDTLSRYLNKKDVGKEELNNTLSAFRASQISTFLTIMLREKMPEFKGIQKVVFEALETGYGEQLPDPSIKNYRKSDERRRVVIIYWSVLPLE
jgi:hypothetical protein